MLCSSNEAPFLWCAQGVSLFSFFSGFHLRLNLFAMNVWHHACCIMLAYSIYQPYIFALYHATKNICSIMFCMSLIFKSCLETFMCVFLCKWTFHTSDKLWRSGLFQSIEGSEIQIPGIVARLGTKQDLVTRVRSMRHMSLSSTTSHERGRGCVIYLWQSCLISIQGAEVP